MMRNCLRVHLFSSLKVWESKILSWINSILHLDLSKVVEACSGVGFSLIYNNASLYFKKVVQRQQYFENKWIWFIFELNLMPRMCASLTRTAGLFKTFSINLKCH